MKRIISFFTFALLISVTCSAEEFEKGILIETVHCLDDSTQSYALYLPSNYSKDKNWPIIYFFEPAARAKLPIEKYALLAERFGYILACTYDAINGPRDPNLLAAEFLINDTFERLNIDKNRMYTAGFSGGSRLATMIAILVDDVSGVIACGAGFPYDQVPTKNINFSYFGLVGNLDMNFQEMMELENVLNQLEVQNQFNYFQGDHDWPAIESFIDVFYWLETNAMRNDLIKINEKLILEIQSKYKKEKDSLSKNTPNYHLYQINNKYLNYLSDLVDVSPYKKETRRIYQSDEFKSELLEIDHITQMEREYQQTFNKEFRQISLTAFQEDYPVKPLSWWKNEVKKLQPALDALLTLEDEMSKRLLNFLLLVSWEEYQNYYKQERYTTAIKFIEISELVGPDEAWVNYLLAKAYAQVGNKNQALKQLNEAVTKGFINSEAIENEKAFEEIKQDKKFKEIVEKMKLNDEPN